MSEAVEGKSKSGKLIEDLRQSAAQIVQKSKSDARSMSGSKRSSLTSTKSSKGGILKQMVKELQMKQE